MSGGLFPDPTTRQPFDPREAFGDRSERGNHGEGVSGPPCLAGSGASDSGDEPWNRNTMAARLARFFREHPHEWIDGEVLAGICGRYGWRTRASQIRRAPFSMVIENRQYKRGKFTVSEYRYVPSCSGEPEAA